MTEPITPALAPDEWRAAIRDRAGFAAAMQHAWGDETTRENDHALAALCLYGQPFGFTQQDVDDLGSAIQAHIGCHIEYCGSQCSCDDELVRLKQLSARIAALLPPPA